MAVLRELCAEDGRVLETYVSGTEDATALVFHHGTPGAATPFRAIERAALERGLRFVSTSRPGYGRSGRREGRTVVDVVADTRAVLAAIGASRCVVAGWSGGGPHALACAARLEEALAVLSIAALAPRRAFGADWMTGMGADNLEEFAKAIEGEHVLRTYLEAMADALASACASDLVSSLGSLLPAADRAVLAGEFGEDLATSLHEALRSGVDGWLDDDRALVEPWGFELDEIGVPVHLWQGSEDLMVPFSHGKWLAAKLPSARVHLVPGEGHLSITVERIGAMLDGLLEDVRSS